MSLLPALPPFSQLTKSEIFEDGDGLVKWVIYRELKDFINLHAHYRVANLRQVIDKFPTFPKTSLPYMNWLKSEGKGPVGRAEFSKGQREVLEAYLLKLIRATVRVFSFPFLLLY